MTKQLIILFILFAHTVLATEIISEDHLVKFYTDDSYSEEVVITGISTQESFLPIRISERSDLVAVKLGIKKGSKLKFKEIKDELSFSSISWSTFFDGSKNYVVRIPPNTSFELRYSIVSNYALFYSAVSNQSDFDASICFRRFEIPEGFQVSTNTGEVWKKYHQVTASPSEDEEELTFLNFHPENTTPENHFNNWFWSRIKDLFDLKESEIPEELKSVAQNESRKELAKKIFEYVQENVRYVDIENGVNAVIPRSASATLGNKYGDCKDMSTLLTAFYKYFGFEAYNSVSKTNSMDFEFNFPSIAMANHMICVLEFEGEKIFLDATEDVCQFGDPSAQIFGTETLPIRETTQEFIKISPNSKALAAANYKFDWEKNKVNLMWSIKGKFNGTYLMLQKKYSKFDGKILRLQSESSKLKWELDSISIQQDSTLLLLSAEISPSMITKMKGMKLLDLSFLQPIHISCFLLYLSDKPLYNSEIKLNYDFSLAFGQPEIQSDLDGVKCLKEGSRFQVGLNFDLKEVEWKDFSEIESTNKQFTTKPIILKNEK